jgi:hypothetical protein
MPRRDTTLEAEGAEHLVLGELLIQGVSAYKAYRRNAGYDLVAVDPDRNSSARIQVKSRWARSAPGFPLKRLDCDFVVFAKLNRSASGPHEPPQFFVFPVGLMEKVREVRPKFGGVVVIRKISTVEKFEANWDLIRDFLARQ